MTSTSKSSQCRVLRRAVAAPAAMIVAIVGAAAGSARADDPVFTVPIPGTTDRLRVPAFFPDRNCDEVLGGDEIIGFAERCRLVAPATGEKTIADVTAGTAPQYAVAVTNAMYRAWRRPEDFLIPADWPHAISPANPPIGLNVPSGGCIWNPVDHPLGDACWPPNTTGWPTRISPPSEVLCSGATQVALIVAQHLFGTTIDPSLLPGVVVPPVVSPDWCPTAPSLEPEGTGTIIRHVCDPPSTDPALPLPNGDGPMYCAAAVIKPASPGPGYVNPCGGGMIPDPGGAIERPDEPIHCASASPCDFPPHEDPENPDTEPVPSGGHCASDNPCIPGCDTLPCGQGDPPEEPRPVYCSGVCDVPQPPTPPHDDVPDPGMDPDAVFNPPIEPAPREKEPIHFSGGDGATIQPSMSAGGAGVSPASTCRPVDLVNGYKMEEETDLTMSLNGRDFSLGAGDHRHAAGPRRAEVGARSSGQLVELRGGHPDRRDDGDAERDGVWRGVRERGGAGADARRDQPAHGHHAAGHAGDDPDGRGVRGRAAADADGVRPRRRGEPCEGEPAGREREPEHERRRAVPVRLRRVEPSGGDRRADGGLGLG